MYGDESCVVPDPTFSIWSNGVLLEENVPVSPSILPLVVVILHADDGMGLLKMDSRASTPTTPMPTSSASLFSPCEPTATHSLDQAHPLHPSNPVVLQTRPPPVVVETKDTIREGLFSELLDRITRRAKARNDVVRYQRRERMQKYSEEGLEEDYSGDFEYGSEDKMPVLVEGRVDGYGEEDEETDEEMPALVYASSFVERVSPAFPSVAFVYHADALRIIQSTLPLNVNKTDPPTLSGLEAWPLSEIDLHWIPPLCYPGDWVHPDHVYPPSLTDSPLPWIVVDSDEAVYSDGSEELDPGSPSYLDSSIAVDGSTRGWLGVNWRKVVESGEGDEREVSWLEIIE